MRIHWQNALHLRKRGSAIQMIGQYIVLYYTFILDKLNIFKIEMTCGLCISPSVNTFTSKSCSFGFSLVTEFGENQICGNQRHPGSSAELAVFGPGWPYRNSTATESELACALACDEDLDCYYYQWFTDNSCRLLTECPAVVMGYSNIEAIICERIGSFFTIMFFEKNPLLRQYFFN